MSTHRSLVLLGACCAITSLPAQDVIADNPKQDLHSGLGRATFGPLQVQPLTGQGSNLGVAYLGGEIYISARGNAGGATGPHTCTVIDLQGNVVRQFQQIGSQASVWGWRDGTSDGVGTLAFGYENTIEFIDPMGARATVMFAANGFQPVSSPMFPRYTGTALGTNRALAYDPNGNNGNGSLWVGDFFADIVELDLAGNELRRLTADGTWCPYGLALHPTTGRLWANSSPNGADGRIAEIDPVTGMRTGTAFPRVEGSQGGLAVVPGGLDGRGRSVDLLSLTQTQTIQGHRIDLYDGVDGTDDVELLAAVDAGTPSIARVLASYPAHTSWSLDLEDGSATPRVPDLAAFAINIPVFALPDAGLDPLTASLFPTLVEIRYQDLFTTPAGVALYVPTTEAAGPLVLAMGPIRSPTLTMHADNIRVQGIYGDLRVPANLGPQVMFTNQTRLWIEKNPTFGIVVTATGSNSFNSTTTSGFWAIDNAGPYEILEATLVLREGGSWDEDEPNMADVFWGGNSTVAGCRGTYRNGSDVACDLDYSGTAAAGCDANAQKGYVLQDARTLIFAFVDSTGPNGGFTSGDKFEWDTDTDGITPISGAGHAGTTVSLRVFDRATGTIHVGTRALEVSMTANQSMAVY